MHAESTMGSGSQLASCLGGLIMLLHIQGPFSLQIPQYHYVKGWVSHQCRARSIVVRGY